MPKSNVVYKNIATDQVATATFKPWSAGPYYGQHVEVELCGEHSVHGDFRQAHNWLLANFPGGWVKIR